MKLNSDQDFIFAPGLHIFRRTISTNTNLPYKTQRYGKNILKNLHARGRGEREIGRNRTAMEVFQGHRCFLLRHSLSLSVSPHPTPLLPSRVDLYTNDESPPCPLSLLYLKKDSLSLSLEIEYGTQQWRWL